MKFKTTIILAIIAIIGAAYVFFYEKKQESVEDKYIHRKKIFFGLNADSIFKIKLIKNGEKYLFEKKNVDSSDPGGQWMMEEPVKTRADKAIINGFLSELEFLERVSHFQEQVKPEQVQPEQVQPEADDKGLYKEDYGLNKPTFEITFWTGSTWTGQTSTSQTHIKESGKIDNSSKPADITEYSFFIGDRVYTGGHVYAQLRGTDEVLVISDSIARKLDFNPNGFRDKWVMDIDEDAVSQVEIQRASEGVIVCSKLGDLWWMAEPVSDRCDNKKIAGIINSLRNLKIDEEDFIADADNDLMKYGLDNPGYRVMLKQNGVRQGVSFGHLLDNKVYAKREGERSIFLVKDIIVNELVIDPDVLRSRELIRFETIAGSLGVDRIEIETRQTRISIKKTKDYDWKITEPFEILADMDVVKELIEEIKDLRILEFVTNKSDDLAKYGLKDPVFNLAIYKEMIDKPTRMLFGSMTKDGNQCYVKRPDEDPVFSITSKGIYEKLLGGLLTFQDKLVLGFDKELVNEVIIVRGDTTFAIKKNSGQESNWILTKPVEDLPDDSLVDQIVQNVSFLKAKRYVAKMPVNLSGFGLDNPEIKVTISYEEIQGNIEDSGNIIEPSEKDEAINKTERNQGDQTIEQKDLDISSRHIVSSVLLIGNKVSPDESSNYFAMVEDNDLVFELDRKVVNYFNSEIVSKSIQNFNAARAKRLVLSYRDREMIFERPEGVWKAVKPELDDIDSRQVEFMIWLLSNLRADQIIEYNLNNVISYGLDNPDIKATVYLDDDSLFEVLAVNNNNGNDYFVMNRNSNCIYSVNKEVFENLIKQCAQ